MPSSSWNQQLKCHLATHSEQMNRHSISGSQDFRRSLEENMEVLPCVGTLQIEYVAFVRKEDCPSTRDHICRALEAVFWGNMPCGLVHWWYYSFKRKVTLWKTYSELRYLKVQPNAPFLYVTNFKLYRHSQKQQSTCSCCLGDFLKNKKISLHTLQNAKMNCIFPLTQTSSLTATHNTPTRFVVPMTKLFLGQSFWKGKRGQENL